MNNEPAVRAETAERVRAAAVALDYSVNAAARQLAGGRTRTLAMVVAGVTQWQWTAELISGAAERAQERGYGLTPYMLQAYGEEGRARVLALAARRGSDGLILTTPWSEDRALARELKRRGAPAVLTPAAEGVDTLAVRVDEAAATERLTAHLLAFGHRRIAVVAGRRELEITRQRVEGVRRALRAASLALEPALTAYGEYSFRSGLQAARRLLGGETRPTAIVALTDVLAAAVLRAAHEGGVAVPDALSVVGVGDLPLAEMVWPALTTAAVPSREMTARAVDLLIDAVEGGETAVREVVFDTRLVVRGSSGPVRTDAPRPGALPRRG